MSPKVSDNKNKANVFQPFGLIKKLKR